MTNIQTTIAGLLEQFGVAEERKELVQLIESGCTLRDIQGLTNENMEGLYALAYSEYNQGKYDKAQELFQLLCQLDHLEKKYWVGLGATRQMLKDYSNAIDAYSVAVMFDLNDPVPPMHAAECHLASGNREEAVSGFQYAIDAAGSRPQYQPIKSQAEARIELIQAA